VSSPLLFCSLRHKAVLTSKATPWLLPCGCSKLEFVYVFVRVSACLLCCIHELVGACPCPFVCVGAQPAVDTKQRSSSAMEEGTSAATPGAAPQRCLFRSAHTFDELKNQIPIRSRARISSSSRRVQRNFAGERLEKASSENSTGSNSILHLALEREKDMRRQGMQEILKTLALCACWARLEQETMSPKF
jgi:hypothetical protein